ncbi:MAG: hypothetical protein VXZ38_03875 [Planctomycetota bacterium]|nr:hypothetical protein [Planctomycetota bacterium]
MLFPYPHPKVIGLTLDPKERATVVNLDLHSSVDHAGLKVGAQITRFGGQLPLSFADIQWVLHQTSPTGGRINLRVLRDSNELDLTLYLADGWREADDISWRVSTWGLGSMVTGGMVLEPASAEGRSRVRSSASNPTLIRWTLSQGLLAVVTDPRRVPSILFC